ncbi:SMURF1 [Cordylochernes scorpioides]|uniref:HECT-type E3 ubiquitin transferase n=1 Tax=Cordylochernes scorpioides TaxID=51811 RepID=A0ABY6JZK5_9ARAC|nr:SMURF1 [Cordylochernes scorpioides]
MDSKSAAFGQLQVHELKPGVGKDIQVTEENRRKMSVKIIQNLYITYTVAPQHAQQPNLSRLYVNYRFMRGIEQQFLALQKGFNELIPQHLLKPFDEKELELVIGGLGRIDIADWRQNTRLKHCGPEALGGAVVLEGRGELLRGTEGPATAVCHRSSRVPLQGFKALQGKSAHATLHISWLSAKTNNTQNSSMDTLIHQH